MLPSVVKVPLKEPSEDDSMTNTNNSNGPMTNTGETRLNVHERDEARQRNRSVLNSVVAKPCCDLDGLSFPCKYIHHKYKYTYTYINSLI